MKLALIRLALALLIAGTCMAGVAPAKRPLSVLIIDGINNHDWEAGTRAIKTILTSSGRFTVDVSTTPPRDAPKAAWDGWRPEFSRYDAVVVNFNGGHKDDGIRWPAEVEQSLEKYVRSGGGLVVFHAANNAFLHWQAWNEMIGLGWRDKSFGDGLAVTNDGKVITIPKGSGLNPGHGPRHDFQICLARDNPITRGLPQCWLHPSEQLSHGQHGPAVGLTILTYALSEVSKQNEPMDWVSRFGKGRVYTTMQGHTWQNEANPNLECVAFQTLLARGLEWTASGRVTIPVPANLPTAQRVSLRMLK